MTQAKSLLHEMTLKTPTAFWNDACDVASLERAVEHGATGATSNPVIVLAAIRQDEPYWSTQTAKLVADNPKATASEIAWKLVERAGMEGAKVLEPVFHEKQGRAGRLSIQVDPSLYRDTDRMVAHAEHLFSLAPNMAIKVPAVAAGIAAVEALTARGVVINATVSFGVPQAIAVAEAVERGLKRAKSAGVDLDRLTPWCTIMVGRLDDNLRDIVKKEKIDIDIEKIRFASTATFRKAYRIFQERGYHTTLLAAAMRSHHHWSEFIGGRVVITVPPSWQDKFNASGVEIKDRIQDPVPSEIVQELADKLPDFSKAYEEDGMPPEAFETYGASVKTLRQFLSGYDELVGFVRDVMLPAP